MGWHPQLATALAERDDLAFVELIAEGVDPDRPLPVALARLGVPMVPHGVRLSLGGVEPLDPARVARFVRVAQHLDAPLVSEHAAFVRAGGAEAGRLLPVPRSRAALRVLTRNIRSLTAELSVPLAVENPAALLRWPDDELDEAAFLTELAERTGAMLLLDVANLYGDVVNHGTDPDRFLAAFPWERVAYLHIAGGVTAHGLYHDSHAHPVRPEVLDLLRAVADHWPGPLPCLLERDARLPPAELDAVAGAASLTRPQSDDHLTAVTAAAGPMPGARVRVGIDASLVDEGTVDEGTQVDAELLAGQIALVRTLTAGEDSPAGFAADRIEATRAALIDKRRLAVGEHWPALAETPGFHDGFAAVVARLPPTTTWADAHAYAQTHNGTLGVEARAELLLAATAGRRWALAASRRGGLLVAIRLPLLGLLILGRRR
ncbi:DUF692 domain-containing protein [Candidatus Frankia alpina]|uniref:DUF692 domain-containing protein n=1 Tax=Candidatus Frankia alpina TaxID=2699483 RepID=UPI001F46F41B|nr:DUF692 domain-containing protein [Candidatus Frankia alpina]